MRTINLSRGFCLNLTWLNVITQFFSRSDLTEYTKPVGVNAVRQLAQLAKLDAQYSYKDIGRGRLYTSLLLGPNSQDNWLALKVSLDEYFWGWQFCVQLPPSRAFQMNFSGAPSAVNYVGVTLTSKIRKVAVILVKHSPWFLTIPRAYAGKLHRDLPPAQGRTSTSTFPWFIMQYNLQIMLSTNWQLCQKKLVSSFVN